jgi:hypothetical protein
MSSVTISHCRLSEIRKKTETKKEREKEKNNLESYIYQTREKVGDDASIATVTTEEQVCPLESEHNIFRERNSLLK